MQNIKEKLINIVYLFKYEILFVGAILFLFITEKIGALIVRDNVIMNFFVGIAVLSMLAAGIMAIFFAVFIIVSVIQIVYYKVDFLLNINKNMKRIKVKMEENSYISAKECLYDIMPVFIRKAVPAELSIEEKLNDAYRLISCKYLEEVLFMIDEKFTNSEHIITTYIEDCNSISYNYGLDSHVTIKLKDIMKKQKNK